VSARIGLDLDGVVYDWQRTYKYLLSEHRGVDFPDGLEWWDEWNAPDRYTTAEDRKWLWSEGVRLGLFRYGNLYRGAIDGIAALASFGDVEVVTHRPKQAVRDTCHFLAGLPDVFAGIHVLTNQEPKSSVGCDVYVDDGPHVAQDIIAAGKRVVLVDRPWNRDAFPFNEPHPSRLVRAYDWPGIVATVRDLVAVAA